MKNTQENGNLAVHLYENALSLKKDEYFGKITQRGSRTTVELAEELAESDSSLTREQYLRASRRLADLAFAYVADGFSVKLDTGTLRAGMSSVGGRMKTTTGCSGVFSRRVPILPASCGPVY